MFALFSRFFSRYLPHFPGLALALGMGFGIVIASPSAQAASETEEILSNLAERVITGHIQPRYKDLQQKSTELALGMAQFCETGGALRHPRQLFTKTVLAFAAIDHIQFGPASKEYRLERFSYWPDRKGRGLRAVRRVLKSGDKTVWKAAALSQKSVAVQGLTALEFLLYGKGSEALTTVDGSEASATANFRCRYGLGIAQNLQAIATELSGEWQDGKPMVTALLTPGTGNKLYRTRKEVILEFYKVVTAGLSRIHDLKMSPLIGRDAAHAKPRRAAFWRSGVALDVIRQNLTALEDLITVSRFRDLLPKKPIDLPAYVDKLFKYQYRAIDGFKGDKHAGDIALILQDENGRVAFQQLMNKINHTAVGFGRNLAVAADLPMGFNASDGD